MKGKSGVSSLPSEDDGTKILLYGYRVDGVFPEENPATSIGGLGLLAVSGGEPP
jgi:hypothetical protein